MQCYITYCIKGFLAFNSDNELISEKLFPENEIIQRLAEINDKKIVEEESEIIKELLNPINDYQIIIMIKSQFKLPTKQENI